VIFLEIEFSIGFLIAGRPKRLFVIVNPFGGDGIGKKVFARTVEPLLKAAGVTITMRGKGSI
jgi:sphingosine kinase